MGVALKTLVLLALPGLLGLALGVWLDDLLGTGFLFKLLLSLVCLGAGLFEAIRLAHVKRPKLGGI